MAQKDKDSGNIARGMAATPITTMGEKLKDALGEDAMKEVEVQSSVEAAAALATPNPVAALLGRDLEFHLPDRERVYKNARTGGISRCMAFATIPLGSSGMAIEGTIYAGEETIGGELERTFSISLPRGISVPKGNPHAQVALDNWKYDAVGDYLDWAEKLEKSTAVGGKRGTLADMRPRHIRRVAATSAP